MITKNKTKYVRFRDICKTHQNMKTFSEVLKTKTFSVNLEKVEQNFCVHYMWSLKTTEKVSLICVFGKPKIYKITKFVLKK